MPATDTSPVIDFHAHFLHEEVMAAARGKTVTAGYGTRPQATNMMQRGAVLFDPAKQVEDMDARGIDINVISSSLVNQGTSWAELDEEVELIRKVNDRAAEWVSAFPDRYVASFVLPLRDIELSLAELERATGELGAKVANLAAVYGDKYLGDPFYDPFWRAVEAAGIPVFIHPEGTTDLWFQDYFLWNSIGQSIEEAKVMASIIYEGVLEKFPGVKIVMAHGAGYFPHYMGRLDRNSADKLETMCNIKGRVSDYLTGFYYDTCTYDLGVVEQLVKIVGADRLVLGSDYPVGDKDPVGFVRSAPSLGGKELDNVLGGTAAKLLGIA